MIPKPLSDIVWDDLVSLKESGREEDDSIEFKESLTGGDDLTALNENQRSKAVDAIAKEVIAFLNGGGGDILIGVRERKNDHPAIEQFTPISNALTSAERLAQALAAIIEPTQALVQIRAILQEQGDDGVLVIRAPSSLRAPHRSRRTKEAFIRRGRASMPMEMEEIQNLTIRRSDVRREKLEQLDAQFSNFSSDQIGQVVLPQRRFRIRAVALPLVEHQVSIDRETLAAANPGDPLISRGGKNERIDVAFRLLDSNWRPVLRGRRIESHREGGWHQDNFMFAAKEIRENGVFAADFSCFASFGTGLGVTQGLYFEWIAGFAANFLSSMSRLIGLHPVLSSSVVRVGLSSKGDLSCLSGDGAWSTSWEWPNGEVFLPDIQVPRRDELNAAFAQWQIDCASIAGREYSSPYQFVDNQ